MTELMGMDERALGKIGTDRYSMDTGTYRAKGMSLDLDANRHRPGCGRCNTNQDQLYFIETHHNTKPDVILGKDIPVCY